MPSPLRGDVPPEVPEGVPATPGDSEDSMPATAAEPFAPCPSGGIVSHEHETEAWRPGRPPARGAAIGVVDFPTHRGEPAEAILDGEGRWHCPQLPVLDRVLNILFDPRGRGEDGAPFGVEELRRVAAWLRGGRVRGDAGE